MDLWDASCTASGDVMGRMQMGKEKRGAAIYAGFQTGQGLHWGIEEGALGMEAGPVLPGKSNHEWHVPIRMMQVS